MEKVCRKCGRKISWSEYSYNGECEECHKNKNCKRCMKEIIGSQSHNGYCEQCYQLIQNEEKEQRKRYCPSCGKEIEETTNICFNCGVNPKNVEHKKYCYYCGKKVNEEQVICLNCKQSLEDTSTQNISSVALIISFLFPIIGLIIYAVNINTNKELANACAKSALCSFVICVIALVIAFIVKFN